MKKILVLISAVMLIASLLISATAEFSSYEKGSKGNAVKAIQNRLIDLGYMSGKADGDYGSGTEKAVIAFQADKGLEENGIIDEATYDALYEGVEGIILFRGIDWHSTKQDVEQKIFSEGAVATGWQRNPNEIHRLCDADSYNFTEDAVEIGGYNGWYSGITVAGYTPSYLYINYMYPINDDGIVHNDESTETYLAWYEFSRNDFKDYEAIYDDLSSKLSSLYGEGVLSNTKKNTMTNWTDPKGNIIRLWIDDDKSYIELGYMAADAEERLEVLSAAAEKEALEAEAKEREENASNTSGL